MTAMKSRREQRLVMYSVEWDRYLAFADALGETHHRLTYDRGTLEFMTISFEHEQLAELIGQFIVALTDELDRPRQSAGATTFNRKDAQRGLEADRCYYFENESKVRGKAKLDLAVDPPPDLAVEIEISRSAANRMAVYASLRVPEVWRYDGQTLTVHQLTDAGEYVVAERSRHFPFLPMNEVQAFLLRRGQVSETELIKSFRKWVREQIARNWQPAA